MFGWTGPVWSGMVQIGPKAIYFIFKIYQYIEPRAMSL